MSMNPQRILWPTDFSALALQGARYAQAFREQYGAELHVVHVVPPPASADMVATLPTDTPTTYQDDQLLEGCRTHLDRLVADRFQAPETLKLTVCFGNPWSMICDYAEEHDVDLIIVATHGRTGLRHVLIGSTAERIVQHAPCPVLVVKSAARDFIKD